MPEYTYVDTPFSKSFGRQTVKLWKRVTAVEKMLKKCGKVKKGLMEE